jgi:ligand-binding sensor domain-containing protein
MQDPAKFSEHHARQKQEMGLQNVEVAYNPNYVVALTVSRDGTVWCGTWGGGLSHFDGSRWQTFTVDDGLPGNHVFMLNEDDNGNLWIGTNKGMARYNGRTFKHYTMEDGLFADNVFSMVVGQDGSFWVGSYGGVARLGGLL